MATAATGSNPEFTSEARQGMGKAALIVALLAVVLMVVFFFSLRQNISAISSQVKATTGAQEAVQTMESKVESLGSRVVELGNEVEAANQNVDQLSGKLNKLDKTVSQLDGLPQETKQIVYSAMLDELAQQAQTLGNQLDNASKKKLQEVNKLLEQVRKSMK